MVMMSLLPVAVTKMSAQRRGVFHGHDLIAFHRRLQRADRIDLRHHDAAAGLAQRRGRAFADVAEARDHRHLARHHHVGAAADAVDQRLAAAVEVVELRLGDAVVDVDRREQQRAGLLHVVEPVHAGGGLFRDALDVRGQAGEVALRLFFQRLLDQREEDFLFFRIVLVEEHGVMVFGAVALMHEHGGVAAVVEDHVGRAAAVPFEQLGGVVPVVLQALALDREHRNAGGGDRGGGVVLRRIDVARHPAHVGAERGQRLDQHRGLDGHVQRAGDARSFERLLGAVLLARRHQAGHLGFGERDFLAAELGERNVLDDVIGGGGLSAGRKRSLAFLGGPVQLTKKGGLAVAITGPAGPRNAYIKISLCSSERRGRRPLTRPRRTGWRPARTAPRPRPRLPVRSR